ncbi:phage tail tape measure protein [Clostridium saccharobutylicum]|uniref:Tape measure protein TMP n=2 Tax=Clostridium saccharobutylicum TaxID=169679 RepID=U5MYG3_CLOSA|nr:phage tail tape measure protein [Clostridium saccharobutylicum]AGX44507.1 tape measure protein TMP [Clostridium saccharobutylicum DSM 13864]AQR91801.1 phage-related minor tail protein [Clostridium saccharobutylicum]AQS01703.1 phage-related minor tail protein [Clostridium saccharobutylicum]AQS15686.1 phage-related minor tail protein [Clostridium saccharobutylicum]MBA2907463.1 TP901 family phage tail tape measure protein [Clostridium saccharobutylicum]
MAAKQVDKVHVDVSISGDNKTKNKLKAIEAMAEQTRRKLEALSKINASPTVKLNDQISSKLNEVQEKIDKLKNSSANVNANVKAKDEASGTLDKIQEKIDGLIKAGGQKVLSFATSGVESSIKNYSEYEKTMSKIKATTKTTDSEMKDLDATAKKLGSSSGWSAINIAEAEKALGESGLSAKETISALPGVLNLATAGEMDLSKAAEMAGSTLTAFNLNGSDSAHVADMLTASANETNSDLNELGETMKVLAPTSSSLGISFEDTAVAAALLSGQNIKGAEAAKLLSRTIGKLSSPTKEASQLMKEHGISAYDAEGKMKPLSGIVENLNSSLKDLTNQQRFNILSTVFGTDNVNGVIALLNEGGDSFEELSKKVRNANGETQKMADTKMDNLSGQWNRLKAVATTMSVTLGERLAPYAKQFVDWFIEKVPVITDKIVGFVDYISNNIGAIKELGGALLSLEAGIKIFSGIEKVKSAFNGVKSLINIFKGAGVAAETAEVAGGLEEAGAAGEVLAASLGPVGIAIGTIAGGLLLVSANNDLMNKGLATTTDKLGPLEKIMNFLNGDIYKSKKEMVDLGLIYDDFGEGISDNFKKAASDASKSLLKLEMNINRLTTDDKFDAKENNQLKNWVNDMAYEGINAIKAKQSEVKSELSKTFSLDGVTSAAEQGTLDYMDKFFGDGVNKELEIRDEIYKIGDNAIKDHGKLLDDDIQQLKDKAAQLQEIKLEYANAENAGELAYSKSKFASKAERVTGIDGAAELLKERGKEHQDSIDETKAKYDKTIATTQYHLDNDKNLTDADKTNLQNAINENKTARDEALKQAEAAWKSDLKTLYAAYPKAEGMFNEKTGAQLSGNDKSAQEGIDYLKGHFENLNQITHEGWYEIKNTSSNKMEDIYATVDKDTGEINGAWSRSVKWAGGYTDELKKKAKELGEANEMEMIKIQGSFSSLAASSLNANNQIIDFNGNVIGQLQGVQGAAGEAVTGIININNTPIQITSNASGQIVSMQEYKGSIDDLPPNADVHINSNADETTSSLSQTTDAANNIPNNEDIQINSNINTVEGDLSKLYNDLLKLTENPWSTIINVGKRIFESGGDDAKKGVGEQASGTNFSPEGFSTVDERGWELSDRKSVPILGGYNGNPLTYMSRGTKILNHMQSVQNMKAEVARQISQKMPNKSNTMQYQVIKSNQQIQVAGAGGISIGDIQVNVDGNQDSNTMIKEVVQVVGYKLKEALTNIKK